MEDGLEMIVNVDLSPRHNKMRTGKSIFLRISCREIQHNLSSGLHMCYTLLYFEITCILDSGQVTLGWMIGPKIAMIKSIKFLVAKLKSLTR